MFFCCFNRKEGPSPRRIDPQRVVGRLMPFTPPERSGCLVDDDALLVHCLHANMARSRLEQTPLRHAASGLDAASWARLDNREELADRLSIPAEELARCGDTELILRSYLAWGEECVERLIGDFVFVIHDRARRTLFCGRDHMGVRPLYYFASDSLFVCATSLAALRQVPGLPLDIDPQWVAEYLLHLSMSFDRTPFQGVLKLPPGHCLTVTPQDLRLRSYFTLSAEPELRLADSRDYVAAYRAQLEEAIRCRLDSEYPIGSELSGGVDSSTVTAFAARFLEQPSRQLHTFAFAFSALEPQYILAVSQECRLANNHVVAARETDPEGVRRRYLDLAASPVEHGNATFHAPFYRLAERLDVRTFLSGFGGDEFGTTIHGYMVPPALAVAGRYGDLWRILPGNRLTRFLRLLKLELRRRRTDNFTAVSRPSSMYEAFCRRWPHRVLREELVRRYGLEERYFAEGRFDEGYIDLKKFTLEKRWRPFMPTRMENCTLMALGYGIEYRWPLLDVRLVRLFLSIPAEENYYRGMGRYLHRRAIDGVVPRMVAWKPGKNMGEVVRPRSDDLAYLRHVDVTRLHPRLGEYLDPELLRRQIEQLPALLDKLGNDQGFQLRKNIQAALDLDAWFRHLEEKESL